MEILRVKRVEGAMLRGGMGRGRQGRRIVRDVEIGRLAQCCASKVWRICAYATKRERALPRHSEHVLEGQLAQPKPLPAH